MSIRFLNAAFNAPASISGKKRLVLLALADSANDDGYCWPKRETIGAKAGISRLDTVTEHLSWLEEEGWIERKVNGWAGISGDIPVGKRPNVYRMTFDQDGPMGPQKLGRGGPQKLGSHGSPETVEENHHREPPHEPTTPTPPEEGKQTTMFESPLGDRPERSRRSRQRSRRELDPISEQTFLLWWKRYPRKGRGGSGSVDRARVAWAKEVDRGATAEELDRQLSNYRLARHTFEQITGEPCWLLAAPKFLKERRHEYDRELTDEEVREHWNIRITRDRKPPAAVMIDRAALVEWMAADEDGRRRIEADMGKAAAHG